MIWSWWLIYFSLAAQRAVASPTVSRLTDTTKFTGSHKERFDQTGRGKGKAGRVDMVDTSGYVSGYKHAGSYEKKVQGKPQQKPVWNLSLNHPQNPIPSTDKARGGESKAQQDHICYFCLFISIFFFFFCERDFRFLLCWRTGTMFTSTDKRCSRLVHSSSRMKIIIILWNFRRAEQSGEHKNIKELWTMTWRRTKKTLNRWKTFDRMSTIAHTRSSQKVLSLICHR